MLKTTEITSARIPSDNTIHQRLLFSYLQMGNLVKGTVLEIGVGDGRGLDVLLSKCDNYTGIDKNKAVIADLRNRYPSSTFIQQHVSPMNGLEDNAYDWIVSSQVIEHIEDDALFLKETYRLLKPGGSVVLTTPNRHLSLTRNPWHKREYTPEELYNKLNLYLSKVDLMGIEGNQRVMSYYHENKKAVEKILKWDFLGLQKKLPSSLLVFPYELLNRWNRNNLLRQNHSLASTISYCDFSITKIISLAIDLMIIATK